MNSAEKEAILSIALLAAFADQTQDEAERAALRRLAEGFEINALDLSSAYQNVLTKRTTMATATAALESAEARNLAFEIALSVCEANGPPVPEEKVFLTALAAALHPPDATTAASPSVHIVDVWPASRDLVGLPSVPPLSAAADIEPVILRYAVITAALELLPQTAGALAIVPAQMKMVYDIGQRHGIVMDRSTVRDFGAALGIGAVTQVLEGGLRKVLSSVLGGLAGDPGKTAGDLSGGVAGTALTFATTYALGSVADRYYAAGRRIDLAALKAEFTELVETAKTRGAHYSTEITEKAKELGTKFEGMDLRKILADLRGGPA